LIRPLLTTKHLEAVFNDSIAEIECLQGAENTGSVIGLELLSSVAKDIAKCTHESFYFYLSQTIRSHKAAVDALMRFQTMPTLLESDHGVCTSLTRDRLADFADSLRELKKELCSKEKPDLTILMRVLGDINWSSEDLMEVKEELERNKEI